MEKHSKSVKHLECASNGDLLFSAGWDGKLLAWDFSTGNFVDSLNECEGLITSISVSNNDFLVSGNSRGILDIFDLQKLTRISNLDSGMGSISKVAVSHDFSKLAVGSRIGEIMLFNMNDESISLQKVLSWVIESLLYTLDNKLLVTGRGKEMAVIDLDRNSLNFYRDNWIDEITSAAYNGVINQVFLGSFDGDLYIFDLHSLKFIERVETYRKSFFSKYLLRNYPTLILSSSASKTLIAMSDNSILILANASHKIVKEMKGNTGLVNCMLNVVERYVIVGLQNGQIVIWDLESGESVQSIKRHSKGVNALKLNEKSNLLFAASDDSTVSMWEIL